MENLLQTVHASRARQKDAASNRLSHGPPAAPPSASTPSEPEISLALMSYEPPADDYLTNRVVAYATSQRVYDWNGNARQTNFAHVELSFAFDVNGTRLFADPNHSLGFSINQFSRLYLREKTWKPEYRCVSISVPAPKYRRLLQICTTLAQLDVPFDSFGMYSAPFLSDALLQFRDRVRHGTFCSRIIVEVLQEAGVGGLEIERLKPWRATPNLLYLAFGGT